MGEKEGSGFFFGGWKTVEYETYRTDFVIYKIENLICQDRKMSPTWGMNYLTICFAICFSGHQSLVCFLMSV